jgi:phosphoglycolate phosphatase
MQQSVNQENVELIIFDWDGTLVDSQANIVHCLNLMINDLKLPTRSFEELSNIIGLGLKEALISLFPEHNDDDFHHMVDRYRYHFFASDPSVPFLGVEDVLSSLSKSGFILAVATGKGRRGLNSALDSTGFNQYITVSRCADETQSKPHPQMLEEILDVTGMQANQAIMVGDTEYDLEMAKNAGIPSIGVSYGVHSTDRLLKHKPISVLNEIGTLLGWLNGEKIAIL